MTPRSLSSGADATGADDDAAARSCSSSGSLSDVGSGAGSNAGAEAAPSEKATAASAADGDATASAAGAPVPCASGVPQSPQKRSVGVTSAPHFGQEDITQSSGDRTQESEYRSQNQSEQFLF
jgi:hypothetical protein